MMVLKRQLSQIFKRSKKRPYPFVKSKDGKVQKGLSALKVLCFEQGDKKHKFNYPRSFAIKVTEEFNILETCLEALRRRLQRRLVKLYGSNNYYFKLKVFPHLLFRHHRIASGPQADRTSTGMRAAFGVPLIRYARLKSNQTILIVKTIKSANFVDLKKELKNACYCVSSKVIISEIDSNHPDAMV